jgi:hypothetical protein
VFSGRRAVRHHNTFCVRSWLRRAKRNCPRALLGFMTQDCNLRFFPKRRRHFIRK